MAPLHAWELRDGDLWSYMDADSLAFQLGWSDCQVLFKSFIEVEYQKLDDVIKKEAIDMINEMDAIMAAAKPYVKRGRISDPVDQFLTAMDDKDKGVSLVQKGLSRLGTSLGGMPCKRGSGNISTLARMAFCRRSALSFLASTSLG